MRFEATPNGTRVTVHQYLRPDGDPDRAFLLWPRVLWMLVPWCHDRDRLPHHATQVARVHVALRYADPAAAARWLTRVFGLSSPAARVPEKGEQPFWVELRVGNVPILLLPRNGLRSHPEATRPDSHATHGVWVFVADLDGHLAHAKANGATILTEIQQHGYRAYEAEDLEGHRWTFAQARPTMT